MKKLLIISILVVKIVAFSQCQKGNCINGNGTYDFGWCKYAGEFKNSKPDGKGTMKYDDYTYVGNFTNGLENGEGIITNNNGSIENVKYDNGVKQVYNLVKIAAKDYKPLVIQDINCISGDCINGFGTLQYPSGNKYVGSFKNYKLEGNGIFYFSNGERYEGLFKYNLFANGTYFFKIGATYKGTYDEKGLEFNGVITSVTGVSIPYVNGKPIIPIKPEVAKAEKNNQSDSKKGGILTFCPACCGTGSVVDRVVTGTQYETTHYKSCTRCSGHGMWMQ